MDAESVNPLLTAKIVGSYLRHNTVGAGQLPDLIATGHRSLRELGRQAPVEQVLTPAVSLRQSVRHEYVVCLDCGYRGKTLRRHIKLCASSSANWSWLGCGGSFRSLEQHPFVRSEMTIPSSRPALRQSAARSGSQGCRREGGGTGGAGSQRPPLARGQALDRASTVLG